MRSVFEYFEEILNIPRESGKEEKIAQYLVNYAKENSNIRKILSSSYRELYGKNATIKKVHACMEGGILSKNIDDLDMCTIAPTIENCHSINETLSISSTQRVYEWLKDTLIKFNNMEESI